MYAAYLYRRRREISIHALRVEGAHGKREGNEGKRTISIHALRVEGDQVLLPAPNSKAAYFYPRPPGGGRPREVRKHNGFAEISIHALRVEGDRITRSSRPGSGISIHALRVEGDLRRCAQWIFCAGISIHALRVEGDCEDYAGNFGQALISIHALRVEGDAEHITINDLFEISIHALRVEGDEKSKNACRGLSYFYPRPPGGGRPREIAYETYAL